MNYCLYKLNFITPVHIGGGANGLETSEFTIYSDTLFSALCIEAIKHNLLKNLYETFEKNELVISNLLPYKGEELYLPKPFLKVETDRDDTLVGDYKIYKKLKYIPASCFEAYIKSLKGEKEIDTKRIIADIKSIAKISVRTNVTLKGQEVSKPYYVGITTYAKDSGLYLIMGFENDTAFDLINNLLNSLSYSGIGGKRTSGFGKFELDDIIYLDAPFNESLTALSNMLNGAHDKYMTVNASLPVDEELDNAVNNGYFSLLRRGGFVQSEIYSDNPLKKQELYAFDIGSCFKEKYKGYIADVSCNGKHSVYRCLKPLFMGVNI